MRIAKPRFISVVLEQHKTRRRNFNPKSVVQDAILIVIGQRDHQKFTVPFRLVWIDVNGVYKEQKKNNSENIKKKNQCRQNYFVPWIVTFAMLPV